MKKLLAILLTLVLLCGLGTAAAEDRIEDAGRVAVVVPAGWGAAVGDEFTVSVVKNYSDQMSMFLNPGVTVLYQPIGMLVADPRDFMDATQDLAPFSLGGRDWTGYSYESLGMKGIYLTAADADGTLVATITLQGMLGGDAVSLEDPDVQAILAGITVKPTMEADWIVINDDGSLTARLPQREGHEWTESVSVSIDLNGGENGPEGEVTLRAEDGVVAADLRTRGSGAFGQYFSLGNGEDSVAEALIVARCEDGKIVAVTQAYIRDRE